MAAFGRVTPLRCRAEAGGAGGGEPPRARGGAVPGRVAFLEEPEASATGKAAPSLPLPARPARSGLQRPARNAIAAAKVPAVRRGREGAFMAVGLRPWVGAFAVIALAGP